MMAAQREPQYICIRSVERSIPCGRLKRYLVSCSFRYRLCLSDDAEAFQRQRLAISPVGPVHSRMMRPQSYTDLATIDEICLQDAVAGRGRCPSLPRPPGIRRGDPHSLDMNSTRPKASRRSLATPARQWQSHLSTAWWSIEACWHFRTSIALLGSSLDQIR